MKLKLIVFAVGLLFASTATHVIAVLFMPEMLLSFVVGKLPGEANQTFHSPRITDKSRRIVRPSPDLLYSICPYELAKGKKLRISALRPANTYISLALYDERTNNYFLLNRRDLSAAARLTLDLEYGPESGGTPVRRGRASGRTVQSPTRKGVALFRILVKGPEQYEKLRAFQKSQNCRFLTAATP